MFFASLDWLYKHPKALVHHIPKFASDHSFLLLEDQVGLPPQARRFFLDKRYLDLPDFEQAVTIAWTSSHEGTKMFQVCENIKSYRIELLKLCKLHKMNSGLAIKELSGKLELLENTVGTRDWEEWHKLKKELANEYKKEVAYWFQKSRVQWL